MSKIDPESFKGKLWLLLIDKMIIGALIALALMVYDLYRTSETRKYEENRTLETRKYEENRTSETRKHEEKRAEVQLDFERARLLKEFMPIITDRTLKVVDRGYTLMAALATKSLDLELGFDIANELIDDGISESHFRKIIAPALPEDLPAIVRYADNLSASWGRLYLFSMINMSLTLPGYKSYQLTERSLHKLESERIPNDVLEKLEDITNTKMWSSSEQSFLDLIKEKIGNEQTTRYKSLILKYGTEDYRIQKQLLFWRALIEDELLSSLDKKFTEKYLPDSFATNNLWGLFALLKSENEKRYRLLQESESRGIRLIGFLSQSFVDYEPGVDKKGISDAVKYISRELDLDFKSIENVKYAQFILGVVESYHNYCGPRSDQARRFIDLYSSLCRIVISDLYRDDDFDFGLRHPDFQVLQMGATSFLVSVGDHAKSCEAELISYANTFKNDVENSRTGEDLTKLRNRHAAGSVMYDVMRILLSIDSPEGKDLLKWIRDLEEEKLKAFGVLKSGLEILDKKYGFQN